MSNALLPQLMDRSAVWVRVLMVLIGIAMLALLSQIAIPLSWTAVPITGQTFGVALLALCSGRKYAMTMLVGYLTAGSMGLPVFAGAASGLAFGPTLGYLLGMFLAAGVVGTMADRGWTKSFASALAAAYLGSVVIFACGLLVLSYFVPADKLLAAGLYPFMIGDLLKNLLAASLASGLQRSLGSLKQGPQSLDRK